MPSSVRPLAIPTGHVSAPRPSESSLHFRAPFRVRETDSAPGPGQWLEASRSSPGCPGCSSASMVRTPGGTPARPVSDGASGRVISCPRFPFNGKGATHRDARGRANARNFGGRIPFSRFPLLVEASSFGWPYSCFRPVHPAESFRLCSVFPVRDREENPAPWDGSGPRKPGIARAGLWLPGGTRAGFPRMRRPSLRPFVSSENQSNEIRDDRPGHEADDEEDANLQIPQTHSRRYGPPPD